MDHHTDGTIDDPDHVTSEEIHSKNIHDVYKNFWNKINLIDKSLIAVLITFGVYSFTMMTLTPHLIVQNPNLLALLTGSSTALIVVGSDYSLHGDNWIPGLVAAVIGANIIAPLFYLMGYRWREEMLIIMFHNGVPRWFQRLETFIKHRPGLSLALCYIPFSPVPGTIMVALLGIERVKWYLVMTYTVVYTALMKGFYLLLGIQFGRHVAGIVKQVDKYILWVTVSIVVLMVIKSSWNQRKGR